MRMPRLSAFMGALALTLATPAIAQTYPDKPVKLVVPFAAGGTSDLISRIVATSIGPNFNGQTMIVENKPGGGGATGATETSRAKPDGYSLGTATVSTIATVPAIQPSTPYNPLTDFTPIINIAATPNIIAVHPSFPAKDYAGFLAELKKNPGKHSAGSSGTGGIAHLLMEIYKSSTGTDFTHVPYRGSGPALNDAIGGQISMIFDNLPSTLPHVKSGKLIPIAVMAPKRLAALPDVPTLAELGVADANRVAFYGIYGPKDMPRDLVDKINAAVKKTLSDANVKLRIDETGSDIIANTPEEFAAEIKAELAAYQKVVTARNLKPE
jgi:tripartite-type tricarboxylate transporter receptor subunit TctC